MSLPIQQHIYPFKPYEPGLNIDEVKQRFNLRRVIKLASNENPLGTSPLVQEALCKAASTVFRYPAAGNPSLREALAHEHTIDPKRIILGNGSDELIDCLIRLCCDPKIHNMVCFKPCFGIYTSQATLCNVPIRQAPLRPDFSFPWQEMLALVDENTALVFVTNPDNPSGRAATYQELKALADALPPTCLLIIDEAYADLTDDDALYSGMALAQEAPYAERIAILRTFSKSRGMAGLRLGYGVVPLEIADYFWRIRLPFSINILAEVAGIAALQDTKFYEATRTLIRTERATLTQGLSDLGCQVTPSQANFLMFSLPQGHTCPAVFEALLSRGIIIRPLTGYALPLHLRVSIGNGEDNAFFLRHLREVLA